MSSPPVEVVIISPMPSVGDRAPSGVAHYVDELIAGLPPEAPSHVVVLAQRDAAVGTHVLPCWREGWWAAWDIARAVRRLHPATVHLQHEVRILGGIGPGLLLLPVLLVLRIRCRTVVTFHGVVPRSELVSLTSSVGKKDVRTRFIQAALWTIFRLHATFAHAVIVHHAFFRDALIRDYGVSPQKARVVPMGYHKPTTEPETSPTHNPLRVLVFGFLADYKRPEDVVALMESAEGTGICLRISVSLNPRNRSADYLARFEALRKRCARLVSTVSWLDYIEEQQLAAVVADSDVVVLPYASCIAVSGVATWALEQGVPLAYDRKVAPLLGDGPASYDTAPASLRAALFAAANRRGQEGVSASFAPWPVVASMTQEIWTGSSA